LVLVGVFHPANADVQVFGFDVADNYIAYGHDEIRRTTLDPFWFVQGAHVIAQRVKK
jgi:hypothetical protein